MTATEERCGHDGGHGIGAGHRCVCAATKGHPPLHGIGHGCTCGALWREVVEMPEVSHARRSVAEADPAILAAAKILAGRDEWDELNVMRQFQHCFTARDMVSAAYNVTFSPENLARTVSATGLSLQTVTEVARELRKP